MSASMRAKMKVDTVTRAEVSEGVKFRAVTNGTPEDNTYSKFTPAAEIAITITNPELLGKFNPGESYYVDFTPAE